jgi:hypothetical protein
LEKKPGDGKQEIPFFDFPPFVTPDCHLSMSPLIVTPGCHFDKNLG